MKSTCLRLLASACILSSGSAFADTSDMAKLFAKGSSFFNPKLSPDGKYLGVESKVDGKDALVILDAQTMKPTNMLRFPDNEQVADYYWVNNERVVASKKPSRAGLLNPHPQVNLLPRMSTVLKPPTCSVLNHHKAAAAFLNEAKPLAPSASC